MNRPLWLSTGVVPPVTSKLSGDREADVAIVGAGITGLTLALLVLEQGRRAVVLEAATIASGTTGQSTGNLYEDVTDMRFLAERWGEDVLYQVIAARRTAVEWIEATIAALDSECGFRRCPKYICAMDADGADLVERTREACIHAGLDTAYAHLPTQLGDAEGPCVAIPAQAQFHPAAWAFALARAVIARGGTIAEHTPVTAIDYDTRSLTTPSARVRADHIVLATHSPKGLHAVQATMPVYREYIAAWLVAEPFPAGIFWLRGDEIQSMRGAEIEGANWLVCAGSPHKPGMHDSVAAFTALSGAVHHRFGLGQPEYAWSAQNYQGADGLPYIGRNGAGAWIATGFKTDGLVWGTVAARALADSIHGAQNALLHLCDPARLSPLKGREAIADETATTVKALVQDYLAPDEIDDPDCIVSGTGALLRSGDTTVAAYREPDGRLITVSPTCTHMGCRVHWNAFEQSWDCPCHGSRFTPQGAVVEGPAIEPLRPVDAQ